MSIITVCLILIFFLALAVVLMTWPSKSAATIIAGLCMVAAFIIFVMQFVR